MAGNKFKQFRDPVHNYIAVPEQYCDSFIDTPIFQRLRNIEQTSMRPLYPSARHDRFSHSLGVFHLAKQLLPFLIANSAEEDAPYLKSQEHTFLLAALMHDCAHAPYSHLLEKYYQRGDLARDFLFSLVDGSFRTDYAAFVLGPPQAHEVFSAAIFLQHYSQVAEALGADPLLVARMITGCRHQIAETRQQELENCLIMLINGSAFDVDKLDYILRDTWASGVNNASIDVLRLLSSLGLRPDASGGLLPVFSKSSLSVVQSVLNGRNFLRLWVHGHHTVTYFTFALRSAFEALAKQVNTQFSVDLFTAMFSKEVFEKTVSLGRYSIYLPTDGDVMYLLKEFRQVIPQVEELLSRRPAYIPLWKTRAEFEVIFNDPTPAKAAAAGPATRRNVARLLGLREENILTLWVDPGISIAENKIHIAIGSEVRTLDRVSCFTETLEIDDFFYAYIPIEHEARSEDCRRMLHEMKIYAD